MADELTRFLAHVRSDPEVERTARLILAKYKALVRERAHALKSRVGAGAKSQHEIVDSANPVVSAAKVGSVH